MLKTVWSVVSLIRPLATLNPILTQPPSAQVYVEVSVAEPAEYFLLMINECWATQSPQPNTTDGSVHTLLQNGSEHLCVCLQLLLSCKLWNTFSTSPPRCVNDHTVSFYDMTEGQSRPNGQSSAVRYSFDMFRFTAEPHDLYLHCTVQLCEPDDPLSCTPVRSLFISMKDNPSCQ